LSKYLFFNNRNFRVHSKRLFHVVSSNRYSTICYRVVIKDKPLKGVKGKRQKENQSQEP